MISKLISIRTYNDLVEKIDRLAEEMQVSRSTVITHAIETFAAEVRKRGYFIPPYEGDDILNDLNLRRRQKNAWPRKR